MCIRDWPSRKASLLKLWGAWIIFSNCGSFILKFLTLNTIQTFESKVSFNLQVRLISADSPIQGAMKKKLGLFALGCLRFGYEQYLVNFNFPFLAYNFVSLQNLSQSSRKKNTWRCYTPETGSQQSLNLECMNFHV